MLLRRDRLQPSLGLALVLVCACGSDARPSSAPPPPSRAPAPPPPVVPASTPPPGAAPGERSARPATREIASPAPDVALSALERTYVGTHALGVNRVCEQRRCGSVSIVKSEGRLLLTGSAEHGRYQLRVSGEVTPVSARKFVLDGELSGAPNMAWAGEAPRLRAGRARYTFEATQGRKFWRLYKVDDRGCVCDERCGNDFCYIDIDFAPQ